MFQKLTRLHFNMDKSGLFVLPRRLKIFKTVFFSVKKGIKKDKRLDLWANPPYIKLW